MAAGEKLQALTDLVDEMVRDAVPGDDGELWALLPTGEVIQLGLLRRRPNGTVWFEGTPVAIPEDPEGDEFGHLSPEELEEAWRDAVGEQATSEQMQARIEIALERAERICQQARSIVIEGRPDHCLGAARRIESGPLPDDVWGLEVFGGAL
jgi:hypothetical protein